MAEGRPRPGDDDLAETSAATTVSSRLFVQKAIDSAFRHLSLVESQQTLAPEGSPSLEAARASTEPQEEVWWECPVSLDNGDHVESALESERDEGDESHRKKKEVIAVPFYKLFSFADKLDIVLMALGTVGAIGNGLSKPLMTLVFGELTNAFGQNANNLSELVHAVSDVSLRYVYLGLGAGFAAFCETSLWMCAGERQATRMRGLYFKSILRQDMSFFDKEASTGEVLSRMAEDTILIQEAIGEKVGKFIQLLSTFFGGFVLAYSKGWKLSLVVSCVLPLLVIAGATMAMVISKMANRGQMAYMEAGDIVQQIVAGIRTVVSFTGEEKAVKNYDAALEKAYKAGVYQGLSSGLGVGCTLLILYLSYAMALWYGSKLILHEGYSGGSVINVIFSILMGGMALGQASPCLGAFGTGRAAAYKMFELIYRIPAIDVYNMDGLVPESMKGDIELRDVTFSYPARPDFRLFESLSLRIPAGTTAALVGESGSGKSTVIYLLERFYDPLDGVVMVDGVDVRKLQLKWLRQYIGLVSQEPVLFGVSIFENVAYGKDGATREEVKSACRLANAESFIEKMPQGYDTHVGHHGTQLSGGQKQRIAIARAILKNPRILLLDEATSALDAESERVVQSALGKIMVDRTTVVVAHRLSTVRDANCISVVQHGRIVEQGTHYNLLADPEGAYSQLIRLQAMQQEVGAGASEQEQEPQEQVEETKGAFCRRVTSLDEQNFPAAVLEAAQDGIGRRWRRKGLPCFKCPSSSSASFMRLASLNKPEAPVYCLGSVAAALNGIVFPMFGLLISSILATFYDSDHSKLRKHANFWAAMFVVLALCCFIIIPTQMFSFAYAGQNLIRRIRLLTFQTVVRQEIGWFDSHENSCGAISARLSTDAADVRGIVGDTLALAVQNLATVGAGLVIAFTATWQLALVTLSLVPLLSLQGIMQVKVMTGFSADAKVMYEAASQIASDATSSIRSVASFGAELKMLKLYEEKCRIPLKNGIRLGIVSGAGIGFANFALFSSYALSFWYGSQLVKDGKSTFKEVFRVFFSITMAAMGVSHAAGLAPDLTKVRASVASIFAMLDRKSKIDSLGSQGFKPELLHGDIQFQHVSFKYPSRPDVQIFRDFSLFVEAGKTAALVGESGSGKSTAISLVQRFYDPDAGKVYIDGQDIRSYDIKWLRQQMSLVGQEPVLFSGTVRSNIAYGCTGPVSEQEIEAAAKAANAHRFICRLPQAYDTQVGEQGSRLSGGQKQRIAIARAVVKDPKVLLLDEATSALDAESERLVQSALSMMMQNRTVLVVAHRLSTISGADMIAVVKNGTVVEQGSHKELLGVQGGVYSLLVKLHTR